MTVVRLFIISLVTFLLIWILQTNLDQPTAPRSYAIGHDYANQDKAYLFDVPEDGQMMKLEFKGQTPMNRWRFIEMEIYDTKGQYIFTYVDELWAESGRDSDGNWTEYRSHAFMHQHFPHKGQYQAYINTGGNAGKSSFSLRAQPIRGDSSKLSWLKWISGITAVICFAILAHRLEAKEQDDMWLPSEESDNRYFWPVVGVFAFLLGISSLFAYMNDDDEVDWQYRAHYADFIYVDRDIRQQSLSGASFRSGSSKGGK